jgi:hypothetical protein
MNCEGKVWSRYLSKGNIARVRVGERVFPVSMQRVTDDEEMARAWLARWEKMSRDEPAPKWPEHYWLYQVNSR